MTNPLDLLTAHYERQRSQTVTLDEITDPVTGDPLVVYFDPPTARQMQQVRARAKDSEPRIALFVAILCAKTKDGDQLFPDTAATVQALSENVDSRVLGKIAKAVLSSVADTEDLGN